MASRFDSIRGIHALSFEWTIKVRVLRIWKAPPYPKNSPHPSLEMVLCDREGSKICAHVKSPFAVKLMNVLKEGSVYVMSQFNVESNSGGFRAAKHGFKLNFQFQARIAETDDDESIERYGFEFLTASRIFAPDFDHDILVDVIGRLIHMGDIQQAFSDPKTKRVNIQLEDQMKAKLNITLWGPFVDQIVEYAHSHSNGVVVIVIQYCKIKEYGGHKTLSNSMFASRMFVNADIPEITEFISGLHPDELSSPINQSLLNSAVPPSPLESAFSDWSLSSIQDFYHAADSTVYVILASVLKVNVERGWYYDSCKKCKCKLEPDFYCTKCDCLVHASTCRYKVELLILDDSGTANVTVFDKDVEAFLGISVIDLRKEHLQNVNDIRQMPERFDRFIGQMFVLKVSVKTSNWNNSYSFTVQKMTSDHDLIEKFKRMAKAKIDLAAVDDALSTPVQQKTTTHSVLDARMLSFADNDTGPSCSNSLNAKRPNDDGASAQFGPDEHSTIGEGAKKKMKDAIV
ncbi:replication protein A 70 kDa DNA-binding subunit-like [Senna tora]|uniref:Replication protein A 70 kDa DNA-binding subunit-like n=1 Tax=Senna tora TaxID=362788 RepID=A0A834VYP7_9FABA|nr:replication protein A 70 kDa DNA-binding subunit-like [Senna tora]